MQYITTADNVSSLPTPVAPANAPGYFAATTDPLTATTLSNDWLNSVQGEIKSVLDAAGLTMNVSNNAQLLQAIQILTGYQTQRTILSGNTTFYVNAASGTDSPTHGGSSGTGAWRSIPYAINRLKAAYDFAGFTVTVSCAGSFTTAATNTVGGMMVGQTDATSLVFDGGNSATIEISSGTGFNAWGCVGGAAYTVQNFALLSISGSPVGGGTNVLACNLGTIYHQGNHFGATSGAHMAAYGSGANIIAIGNYVIAGGALAHMASGSCAFITTRQGLTVTLTSTPAFTAFAEAVGNSNLDYSLTTFSGAATGARYSVGQASAINTTGGGANFFPGNSAGFVDPSGSYT